MAEVKPHFSRQIRAGAEVPQGTMQQECRLAERLGVHSGDPCSTYLDVCERCRVREHLRISCGRPYTADPVPVSASGLVGCYSLKGANLPE